MNNSAIYYGYIAAALHVATHTIGSRIQPEEYVDWWKKAERDKLVELLLATKSPWYALASTTGLLPFPPADFPKLKGMYFAPPRLIAGTNARFPFTPLIPEIDIYCPMCSAYYPAVFEDANATFQEQADMSACPSCSNFVWPWCSDLLQASHPILTPAHEFPVLSENILFFPHPN